MAGAAASRARASSALVVPSPVNESQWDGPSSTTTVTFGPLYRTASAIIPNGDASVIRHATSKNAGKYYAEFQLVRVAGGFLPAMGVMADLLYPFRAGVPVVELGGAPAWTLRASGDLYANGALTSTYTPAFSNNDVAMLAVDLTAGRLWFGRNGTWVGDPSLGTSPAFSNLISIGGTAQAGGGALATLVGTIGYSGGGADYGEVTARFSSADWQYTAPTGFGEWTP